MIQSIFHGRLEDGAAQLRRQACRENHEKLRTHEIQHRLERQKHDHDNGQRDKRIEISAAYDAIIDLRMIDRHRQIEHIDEHADNRRCTRSFGKVPHRLGIGGGR